MEIHGEDKSSKELVPNILFVATKQDIEIMYYASHVVVSSRMSFEPDPATVWRHTPESILRVDNPVWSAQMDPNRISNYQYKGPTACASKLPSGIAIPVIIVIMIACT